MSRSDFAGAISKNDYLPSEPYTITVSTPLILIRKKTMQIYLSGQEEQIPKDL